MGKKKMKKTPSEKSDVRKLHAHYYHFTNSHSISFTHAQSPSIYVNFEVNVEQISLYYLYCFARQYTRSHQICRAKENKAFDIRTWATFLRQFDLLKPQKFTTYTRRSQCVEIKFSTHHRDIDAHTQSYIRRHGHINTMASHFICNEFVCPKMHFRIKMVSRVHNAKISTLCACTLIPLISHSLSYSHCFTNSLPFIHLSSPAAIYSFFLPISRSLSLSFSFIADKFQFDTISTVVFYNAIWINTKRANACAVVSFACLFIRSHLLRVHLTFPLLPF